MYLAELFLGFRVGESYRAKLDLVDRDLKNLFLKNDQEIYLEENFHEGIYYLGKSLGKIKDFSSLEALEANIYSLLKKLVPDYPYSEEPLSLFPILKELSPHGS
jgi:hypothetical protein